MYLAVVLISAACSSVLLQSADYSWPVESVLRVDQKGFVFEDRHSFSINVEPLFYEEFADSSSAFGKEVRIIRNRSGNYYITGSGFKNVYLFTPIEGGMKMEDKISISDSTALNDPAFNQKTPNVELLDGMNKYLLTANGIARLK